jgi:pSer/pThr/pTyr-binding forkhead associated (FHA) protein
MSPQIILLILRLLSAAVLLTFLALIAWFSYKELKLTSELYRTAQVSFGSLEVIESLANVAPVGHAYSLRPILSIGRSTYNSIVLDDEFVSNEHVLITKKNGKWWLEDLSSRNGTLLNDLPLTTATIVGSGDTITIGQTTLKLNVI